MDFSPRYCKTISKKESEKNTGITTEKCVFIDNNDSDYEADSDDIFSDNDEKDSNLSLNTSNLTDSSFNNLFENPLRSFSSGTPVVPSTPISLLPILSNINEQWTSDLETPQADKQNYNMSRIISSTGTGEKAKSNKQNTPSIENIRSQELVLPPSSPVIMTKKFRKRAKRRIFKPTALPEMSINDNELSNQLSATISNTHTESCTNNIRCSSTELDDLKEKAGSKILLTNNTVYPEVCVEYEDKIENENIVEKVHYLEDNLVRNTKRLNSTEALSESLKTSKKIKLCESHSMDIENKNNELIITNSKIEETANIKPSIQSPNNSQVSLNNSVIRGNKINISPESVGKGELCLENNFQKKKAETNNLNLHLDFATTKGEKISNSQEVLEKEGGFQTAKGDKINISQDALEKAKSLFNDVLEKADTISHNSNMKIGYITAKEEKSNISQESLVKVKSLLDNVLEEIENNLKNSNPEIDFKTAKGEKISISQESLKKAVSLLEDDYKQIRTDSKALNPETSFKSAKREKINIEQGALEKTKSPFGGDYKKIEKSSKNFSPDIAFKTAKGKPIKISEENLEKAKSLLNNDLENIETGSKNYNLEIDFKTAKGEQIEISHKALKKAKSLLDDELEGIERNLKILNSEVGFKTAKGESIQISQKALEKAKSLLEDDNERIKPTLRNACLEVGFKTAKGGKITISKEAANKAVEIFKAELSDETIIPQNTEKLEETPQTTDFTNCAIGFTTANGGKLTISKEALNKAQLLFTEELGSVQSIESSTNIINARPAQVTPVNAHFKSVLNNKATFSKENFVKSTPLNSEESSAAHFELTPLVDKSNVNDSSDSVFTITSKRKNEDTTDDETPVGRKNNSYRKKARLSDELIGRKLFTNVQEDDDQDDIKLTDSDELLASTAALLADENSKSDDATDWKVHKITPIKKTNKNSTTSENKQCVKSKSSVKNKTIKDSSSDYSDNQIMLDFINQSESIVNKRIQAGNDQLRLVEAKKKNKPKPITGRLFSYKQCNKSSMIRWREITAGNAPLPYTSNELAARNVPSIILQIDASFAVTYKFSCADFYGHECAQNNVFGVEMDDGTSLIFDEHGLIGISEISRALKASKGVDPTLIPEGWIENHYRWIVWKLASMDRMNFINVDLPRALTPSRVMEQLKYRYDREIDRAQRPALRMILEKDEPANRRMILCVSSITEIKLSESVENSTKSLNTLGWKLELTDGWYSIPAAIDSAMANYIISGKLREGSKIVTSGAELLNCDRGCSPLQIPSNVNLKIHTNSTRRAMWYTKMGFLRNKNPINVSLNTISPNGGLIGKCTVIVVRVYPILYHEKMPDGESIFRNARSEEKANEKYEDDYRSRMEAMYDTAQRQIESGGKNISDDDDGISILVARLKKDKEELSNNEYSSKNQQESFFQQFRINEEKIKQKLQSKIRQSLPARNVTPVLKARVVDKQAIAILTIWSPSDDIIDIIKEGNCISVCNAIAAGRRLGELQITVGRNAFLLREAQNVPYPQRTYTPLIEIANIGFNPMYGEIDTIGVIVSISNAPYGMKNFESINLACPNGDSSESSYLSILFWQGVKSYGYADMFNIGSVVACSSLEWRRSSSWNIPVVYCTERTAFTRNPKNGHLQQSFKNLEKLVKNQSAYAEECASKIAVELQKKPGSRTPIYRTPDKESLNADLHKRMSVPLENHSLGIELGLERSIISEPRIPTIQSRIERLQCYGEPPELTPIALNVSKKAQQAYQSPVNNASTNSLNPPPHNSSSLRRS
ncbi:breast cancer type 2 susceptibility protein-like isoform X2 [Prorops nasuta]|uniref:breast cancer type 2 susceptibility protein-like isoform X2 n=1 Tax=Prorops nasuta TaxID=863751 RepID=UPI0034CE0956